MLVLSRRIGETLMIGDNIEIINLGINGNKIRIGIKAPKHITVHRQEVYDKINGRKKDKAR